jgi:uroporphyrinogen III methyltransferase/synthase
MADFRGQRVIVTRSAEDSAEWVAELERTGADVLVYPCITTQDIDTPRLRTALAASAATAEWLIFTSARGVERFAALHPGALAARTQLAAVGATTAGAARRAFGRVDHVGGGTALSLAESLVARREWAPGVRCLLAVAENAATLLERKLAAAGAVCERFAVYRTISTPSRRPKQPLSALHADKILFASPSAVAGFANQVEVDAAIGVFTIGPTTSAAARSHGLRVTAEAREPSLEGLLEAMHG